MKKIPFEYTGVDINIQPQVESIKWSFIQSFPEKTKINLINENSIAYLSKCNEKFDVIMIDGDHNYETVKTELSHLEKISHNHTLIICDDYNGRHSSKDLYYSQRPEFKNNKLATEYRHSEKQGVAPAVDEFLKENEAYTSFSYEGLQNAEPICLVRLDNKRFVFT